MNGRAKAGRFLVAVGCFILFAAAAVHCGAAYPKLSIALARSNLDAGVAAALRAIFLVVGWDWFVIAILMLIVAFKRAQLRKPVVLLCGAALLVQAGITLKFVGWFVGTDMILAAAVLTVCGGLLFERPAPTED